MAERLDVVLIEPYYGGSHAAFADAIRGHSRHRVRLLTLPARKWKWRMRGAALWFTLEEASLRGGDDGGRFPDVMLVSDMLSVSDLRATLPAGRRDTPIICYFHENQLTYPLSENDFRDYQYGFTNIASCQAADAVWFNSAYHRDAFLEAVGNLLRRMPDASLLTVPERIAARCAVVPPPVDVPVPTKAGAAAPVDRPMRILWPHRWEFDKNPEAFFEAVCELTDAGVAFELVLLGEQFRTAPPVFAERWPRLAGHIVHGGFIPDRAAYLEMVATCDLVVSTAIQENFGLAVAEAILLGCQPLLPDRLAYPELIPAALRDRCLYSDDAMLAGRLQALASGRGWLSAGEWADLQGELSSRAGVRAAVGRIDEGITEVWRVGAGG